MLQAKAETSNPPKIKIGSVVLSNNECMTRNAADAKAVSGNNGGDYVAYYKDGVLYLNGLNVNDGQILWSDNSLGEYGNYHLTIQLADGTVNTVTNTKGSAILGNTGLGTTGPYLTVQGNGTLYAVGKTCGIWVWNDTTIQGAAKVIAQGTTKIGIASNKGNVTIKGNADVTAIGGNYGISGDNNYTLRKISVTDSVKLLARGKKAMQIEPTTSLAVNYNNDKTACAIGQEYIVEKATPETEFSATGSTIGRLKKVEAGMKYKMGYTDWVDVTSDAPISLSGLFEGCTISVVRKGDGSASVDSNVQVYVVDMTVVTTTYTVTFDANGHGTAPAAETVESGKTASEPAALTAEGYTFGGWYTDAACTTKWDFSTAVTADITLYAKWTENAPAYSGTVTEEEDSVKGVTAGGYYPTVHNCVSKCEICGGCKDMTCTASACANKCTLLTMSYADVTKDLWCHANVAYVHHYGLMNGYGSEFRPGGMVTRQQVWMVLARLSGADPANMTEARTWAMTNGVSDGSNPKAYVTRQQFVTMLYRYAVSKGYDVSVGKDTNILSYTDAFDVAEYAVEAMQWACGEGIIGGYSDGSLKPMNNSSRGHMAAFLQRFCEAVK